MHAANYIIIIINRCSLKTILGMQQHAANYIIIIIINLCSLKTFLDMQQHVIMTIKKKSGLWGSENICLVFAAHEAPRDQCQHTTLVPEVQPRVQLSWLGGSGRE